MMDRVVFVFGLGDVLAVVFVALLCCAMLVATCWDRITAWRRARGKR